MSNGTRGPESLRNVLAELVGLRCYNEAWNRHALQVEWNTAVGKPECYETRIDELRHGVLKVTVAHSVVLEELAFRKPSLIALLQCNFFGIALNDIQFRVGSVGVDVEK